MVAYIVKMAEFKTTKGCSLLRTNSLGSCVGVILYDNHTKIGGMAHIMLPKSPEDDCNEIGRYADLAIPQLFQDMIALGAHKHSIRAMLFGGADMFITSKNASILKIGFHNIEMSKKLLQQCQIPIVFEEVGGKKGRSVELNCETGEVSVQDYLHDKQQLSFH